MAQNVVSEEERQLFQKELRVTWDDLFGKDDADAAEGSDPGQPALEQGLQVLNLGDVNSGPVSPTRPHSTCSGTADHSNSLSPEAAHLLPHIHEYGSSESEAPSANTESAEDTGSFSTPRPAARGRPGLLGIETFQPFPHNTLDAAAVPKVAAVGAGAAPQLGRAASDTEEEGQPQREVRILHVKAAQLAGGSDIEELAAVPVLQRISSAAAGSCGQPTLPALVDVALERKQKWRRRPNRSRSPVKLPAGVDLLTSGEFCLSTETFSALLDRFKAELSGELDQELLAISSKDGRNLMVVLRTVFRSVRGGLVMAHCAEVAGRNVPVAHYQACETLPGRKLNTVIVTPRSELPPEARSVLPGFMALCHTFTADELRTLRAALDHLAATAAVEGTGAALLAGAPLRHIALPGSFVVVRDQQWGEGPAGRYDEHPAVMRHMDLAAERVRVVLDVSGDQARYALVSGREQVRPVPAPAPGLAWEELGTKRQRGSREHLLRPLNP